MARNTYGYSDKFLNLEATSRNYTAFESEGLTAFYAAGFRYLPMAQMWSAAGFTAETALAWRTMAKAGGWLPIDCAEWRDAGFTPDEAADWSRNYSVVEATDRRRKGKTSRMQYYPAPMRLRS